MMEYTESHLHEDDGLSLTDEDSVFSAPKIPVRGVYVVVDTDNVQTYVKPCAVTLTVLAHTCVVVPTAFSSNHLAVCMSPIICATLFFFIKSIATVHVTIDDVSGGAFGIWYAWVVYGFLWGNHPDAWWADSASFALSAAAIASSVLIEFFYEKITSPRVVRTILPYVQVTIVAFFLCFAHSSAVLQEDKPYSAVARVILFLTFCWVDMVTMLMFNDGLNIYSFFANKWWIFYVHPWLLPVQCIVWIKIGIRRSELYLDKVKHKKEHAATAEDGSTEMMITVTEHDDEDPHHRRQQSFMFQRGINRTSSMLKRGWRERRRGNVEREDHSQHESDLDISKLKALANTHEVVGTIHSV
tara:strand:- start:2487 stop:3554 length:1068 start_codon:yes stop_codon:yes gene_type:complete